MPKNIDRQQTLFGPDDRRLKSMAQTRTWAGDAIEQVTVAVTGAVRLKTDARCDICPDLQHALTGYLECKSVGNSGRTILYQHRMNRDVQFTRLGNSIHYFFWLHDAVLKTCEWRSDAQAKIIRQLRGLLIVDQRTLLDMLLEVPLSKINYKAFTKDAKKLGYGSNGYGIGWRVAVSAMRKRCEILTMIPSLSLFDSVSPVIPVQCSSESGRSLIL